MWKLCNFLRFVLVAVILLLPTLSIAHSPKEGQLIRRIFLIELGIPPTVEELDWYLTYNEEPYIQAVAWVLDQNCGLKNKENLKLKYLSSEFKTNYTEKLSIEYRNYILKYQAGCLLTDTEYAKKKLIEIAKIIQNDNVTDVIDYMSEALTGRLTNLEEINTYLKIYKKYPASEDTGYLEILNLILESKDCVFK